MLRTLFSAGYRPFFLLAALNACASMFPWLYMLFGGRVPTQGWPAQTLHAHEMIYGTVVPVIAGFLLTAAPNWTSTKRVSGAPLVGLVLLYLAGRVALVSAGTVDPFAVALIEVAFLPALAWFIGAPILRTKNWRNTPVIFVLLGLAVANATIHWGLAEGDYEALRRGTYASVYLIVVLMVIISGRVVPLFTRNVLKQNGVEASVKSDPRVDGLAMGLACSSMLVDLVEPRSLVAAILALAASPVLLLRQIGWQFRETLAHPMLWILHVGHAWLAIGFACMGLAVVLNLGIGAAALHAFTAGAMGTLILGMMPRVSLGHSGRPIEAARGTVWMFGLVILGAAIRIVGASGPAELYQPSLLFGGAIWASAWVLFCVLYAGVLMAGDQAKGTR